MIADDTWSKKNCNFNIFRECEFVGVFNVIWWIYMIYFCCRHNIITPERIAPYVIMYVIMFFVYTEKLGRSIETRPP